MPRKFRTQISPESEKDVLGNACEEDEIWQLMVEILGAVNVPDFRNRNHGFHHAACLRRSADCDGCNPNDDDGGGGETDVAGLERKAG